MTSDVTKAQLRVARTLIGLTQAEVCEKAGIPLITLRRIEGQPDHTGLVALVTVTQLRELYERLGVQFLEAGDLSRGKGVSLRETE